ncbi:MAG TPA: 16S rRNA (cytosine(967)-C(5))-methyltransferase RsmB [Gammaproteobacteria bacterium]|nr:16S rRNA (cytosine(967)-C(5))-methyltransferase RsmB [Gammaproteobacteria bacterium]
MAPRSPRSARAARPGAAVRAAAAVALARVLRERIDADDALAAVEREVAERDRALLGALVFGALRWYQRLEWQSARLLTKPLKPGQLELGALLKVGLFQLQETRIPEHAAVSATVDAAAVLGHRDAAPLVNAVLRRFQRERGALDAALAGDDEARLSHPRWLLDELAHDWPDDWQRICAANNSPAPMWLRVNERHTTRADYLARLQAAGFGARPDEQVPTAIALEAPQPVEALPGFAAGDASVQDVAAQRAVGFLDLAPGQRVLDACAAPGGKTCHILEACPGLEEVWALDRDASRLERVRENLGRLGLAARLVPGDATRPEAWWDGRPFERILLDAPCSAVGVIRRHPDIKVLRRPEDVARAVALQGRLLRALWPLLAPGGRLVYATCSVLRRENDAQIAAFVADLESSGGPGTAQLSGCQSLPGDADGDGFYYACLLKPEAPRPFDVFHAQQSSAAQS